LIRFTVFSSVGQGVFTLGDKDGLFLCQVGELGAFAHARSETALLNDLGDLLAGDGSRLSGRGDRRW